LTGRRFSTGFGTSNVDRPIAQSTDCFVIGNPAIRESRKRFAQLPIDNHTTVTKSVDWQ
jgi:hypothetical protein